jgi:hypothetical protein
VIRVGLKSTAGHSSTVNVRNFVPPAYRYDPGVLLSAIGRYLPQLASGGTDAMKLTGPFSKVRPQG